MSLVLNHKNKIEKLLKQSRFTFAKSMPTIPHEYTLRKNWYNDNDFVDAVLFIRKYGQKEYFGKRVFTYYYLDGYKYWTMGNPVEYGDKSKTILINRAKVEI